MIVIIVGSCMVPIIGTMQRGLDFTDNLGHKARMRLLAESRFNESVANCNFLGLQPVVGTTTLAWPDNVPADQQVATYLINIAVTGQIEIATISGGVPLSGIDSSVVGTQPTGLNEVVITVSLVNSDPSVATETIRLSTLLISRSFTTMNALFLADTSAKTIFIVDPFKRSAAPRSFSLAPACPGSIAVHPSGKWLAVTSKTVLYLVDIDPASARFGEKFPSFSQTGTEFLAAETTAGTRGAQGIAFRPDGRYCYVTTTKDANTSPSGKPTIAVFQVPTTLPGSFTRLISLPASGFPTATGTDFVVGEDGYLYHARSENDKIYRLPLGGNPHALSTSDLETYTPTFKTFSVPATKVMTSRTGRELLAIWPGSPNFYSWSSVTDPGSGTIGTIGKINSLGGSGTAPITGGCITRDGRWALLAQSLNYGGTPAKYYDPLIKLPPNPLTTNSAAGLSAPNTFIQNGETATGARASYYALPSPSFPDVILDQDSQGYLLAVDLASAAAGSCQAGVEPTRMIPLRGMTDAFIAARPREEILVGASDGVASHTLERIDLYARNSQDKPLLYSELSVPLAGKPLSLALDGGGCLAAVATGGTGFQIVDIGRNGLIASAVSSVWTASTGVFLLDGGFLAVSDTGRQFKVFRPRAASSLDPTPDSSLSAIDETLETGFSIKDIKARNNGGAFVLATNWTSGSVLPTHASILYFIGPDYVVRAKWDSRFDNFPPQVVTRLAVSPDDSLLALLVPDFAGGSPYFVDLFDTRTQDFATLTYQLGVIREIRTDLTKTFQLSTPYELFTAASPRLQQAFTAFGNFSAEPVYGLNFLTKAANKFVPRTTHSFGYLRVPSAGRVGFAWEDAYQLYLDGEQVGERRSGSGAPDTAGNQATFNLASTSAVVQANLTCDGTQAGHGLFFHADRTKTLANTDILSVFSATDSVRLSTTGNSGGWSLLDKSNFRPMRFNPQFLHRWTSPDYTRGDSISLAFGRTVTSPLLFVLNRPEGVLHRFSWGGTTRSYDFSTGTMHLAAGAAQEMAVSPDGQRLLITSNAATSSLLIVDISLPETASYGVIIAAQDLPRPAMSMAVRPFNRVYGPRNTYQALATMPYSVTGNSLGALGPGGIFLVGGTESPESSDAVGDAVQFVPPLEQSVPRLGVLPTPLKNPINISYDGKILTLGGTDEGGSSACVSQWDPRTSQILPAFQGDLQAMLRGLTPKMTDSNLPAGYLVSTDNFFSAPYGAGTVDYEGWRAFDQDIGFPWIANTSPPHWIQFDFPYPQPVGALTIHPCDAYFPDNIQLCGSNLNDFSTPGNFDVLLDDFYVNYRYVQTATPGYTVCLPQTYHLDNTAAYRNYRLVIPSVLKSDTTAGTWVGFREIQLLGNDSRKIVPQDYMASLNLDVPDLPNPRTAHGGALTPYGVVMSGGSADETNATSSTTVFWPHGIEDTRAQDPDVHAWWKFEESSGLFALDSAYNEFNGTLASASWVEGYHGNALDFYGSPQAMTVPDGVVASLTDFSITFWIKSNAIVNDACVFEFSSAGNNFMRVKANDAMNRPVFQMQSPATTIQQAYGASQIPVDKWTHVGVTKSGNTVKFFLNGVPAATTTWVFPITAGNLGITTDNTIGRGQNGIFLNSALDDFYIFNRALTNTQIRILADRAGIAAWYPLDEAGGTTAIDASGMDRDATINGSVLGSGLAMFGNARSFNGTSDALTLPPDLCAESSAFSFCCWIKPNVSPANDTRIFELYTDPSNFAYLGKGTTGKLIFNLNGSSVVSSANFDTLLPAGAWSHLALTQAAGTDQTRFYVNGAQVATGTIAAGLDAITTPTVSCTVGSSVSGTYLNAAFDDIMIFSEITTAADIRKMYEGAFSRRISAQMTNNTTPSPNAVSATSKAFSAYKAFDLNMGSYYLTKKNRRVATLTYDFGAGNPQYVDSLYISTQNTPSSNRAVKDFIFCGSTDKTRWIPLRSGSWPSNTASWTATSTATIPYRYYSFCIRTNWGNWQYSLLNELQLWADPRPYIPPLVPFYEPTTKVKATPWGISRQLPNMAAPIIGHVLIYHQGFLYRLGGASNFVSPDDTGTAHTIPTKFDRFDFSTNAWTQITPPQYPYPYVNFGACSYGNEIFFFGGSDSSHNAVSCAKAWNPDTGRVRALTNLPTPRHSCTAVPCGPFIYILGGTTSTTATDGVTIYRYTP